MEQAHVTDEPFTVSFEAQRIGAVARIILGAAPP
jgi:hypothetical protein